MRKYLVFIFALTSGALFISSIFLPLHRAEAFGVRDAIREVRESFSMTGEDLLAGVYHVADRISLRTDQFVSFQAAVGETLFGIVGAVFD